MNDTSLRSVVKTLTWRFVGTLSTGIIAFILTTDVAASTAIASVQLVANTALYFIHERVWNVISWGRRDV